MANLHKYKYVEDEVTLLLCKELGGADVEALIETILGQFPALPFKVYFEMSDQKAFAPDKQIQALNFISGRKCFFVQWKPGQDYKLGTRVANSTSTKSSKGSHTGLCRINDIRLQQTSAGNPIYLANVIVHEFMHMLGIDHPTAFYYKDKEGKNQAMVRKFPIMVAGKFTLGLSYDDKQGLRERYETRRGKTRTVTIKTDASAKQAVLFNRDKPNQSVGKNLVNGQAIIPYVKPGNYWLVIDRLKSKRFKVGDKDKVITTVKPTRIK